jgi:DNA-binding transcriptional ArsR family regulator
MGHGIEGKATPPAQLDAESAASVAATLQALATPSRLRILTRLRHGACSVNELSAAVEMEQSAVSHQLRLLRAMGLVTGARNGRSVIYALYDNHVAMLLDEAVYHIEHLGLGVPDEPSATARRALAYPVRAKIVS